jgi:hypothetical protein
MTFLFKILVCIAVCMDLNRFWISSLSDLSQFYISQHGLAFPLICNPITMTPQFFLAYYLLRFFKLAVSETNRVREPVETKGQDAGRTEFFCFFLRYSRVSRFP